MDSDVPMGVVLNVRLGMVEVASRYSDVRLLLADQVNYSVMLTQIELFKFRYLYIKHGEMKKVINIAYPESLADSLRLKGQDFVDEMKISSMVKLFEMGKVSSGTAAKVLGISRLDFLDLLSKYQVSPLGQYDSDDLKNDILNA